MNDRDELQWYGGGSVPDDVAAVFAAVREHLRQHTAMTAAALAQQADLQRLLATYVDEQEPLSAAAAEDLLDELLDHVHADQFGWIVDGRNYLPGVVMRDVTATLRVTSELLTEGHVFDGPDLALLANTERRTFPLAGGGEAGRTVPGLDEAGVGPDAFRFVLPTTALPDDALEGDLLALTWDGEELSLRLVDEPSEETTEAAAAAVWASFATLVREADLLEEGIVESAHLTAVARIDHDLFSQPCLPVTELVAHAGLSVHGDHVAEAGHDWDAWLAQRGQQIAVWSLAHRHGLDNDEAMALLFVLGAVDREHAATTGEAPGGEPDAPIEPPVSDEQLPLVLGACANPDVVRALVDETAYDEPWLAPGLRALAERLRRTASGRDRAVAHYLLACAAEAVGEVEEATRQARLAVQANPQHSAAAWLATRYASLQGRAGEALRHLTAVWDVPPGDHVGDLLRRHAEPGPTEAPRNAPCPCGSSRKHKVCCGPHNGWPLSERVPWLLTKLRDHASSAVRWGELDELAEAIAGQLTGEVRDRTVEGLLGNAFVHGLLLWEGGVLAEFLDTHAPLLPADELDLARRWLDAELDLWEVTEVRPGEGLALLGLYRGATVDVQERAFSQQATVGQTILARVLDAVDHLELQAVFPVDLHLREHLLADVFPDDPDHLDWATVIAPRQAALRNGDGHQLVHHRVTYDLDVPADTAAAALAARFEPNEDEAWVWLSDADVVRGELWLDDGRLVTSTNSDERCAELDAALCELFDDALKQVDDEVTTVADMLERTDDQHVGGGDVDEEVPDEAIDAVRAYIRQAEQRWVDESIPALGGLTPREALADPTRRGDLLALLDEFDRAETPEGGLAMDAGNLRDRLGLTGS